MTDESTASTERLSPAEDSTSVYSFETDCLAFRGNKDYQRLLGTIVTLESQRVQALQDIETLMTCQAAALADPIQFVHRLQQGVDLDLPPRQKVAELPTIAWENYTNSLETISWARRHATRHKNKMDLNNTVEGDSASEMRCDDAVDSGDVPVVRGRVKRDGRPTTFNQLWTAEEQRRLEQLLLEHPPEDVEARRWDKIARALTNRTAQQVASRVQKYFIKLAKAGLPVPGRIPSVSASNKKGTHRHQRYNRFYFQPSTFMTSIEPPVYMSDGDNEDDDGDTVCSYAQSSGGDTTDMHDDPFMSEEEDIPAELCQTSEYAELMRLKQLRREKLRPEPIRNQHIGYKCDRCDCEPIVGTRWHCRDCPVDLSVDMCEDCVGSGFETDTHDSSHRLDAVHHSVAPPHMDQDYMRFMPGGYNYLDPNYMPAV